MHIFGVFVRHPDTLMATDIWVDCWLVGWCFFGKSSDKPGVNYCKHTVGYRHAWLVLGVVFVAKPGVDTGNIYEEVHVKQFFHHAMDCQLQE